MDVIHTVAELRARLKSERQVGLVPTMGNLHEGHIALSSLARERAECSVVSIFVNRLQFGPNEDFDRYPRTLASDSEKCAAAGVDVVFAPDEKEMYPEPQGFAVDPDGLQHILDGAVRPGHFRGVATVVMKLLNQVQPQVAVFGKKDYQQCKVLAAMIRQFALPVKMVFAEIVRAPDGLALSSRNAYLDKNERAEAPQLHRHLQEMRERVLAGGSEYSQLESQIVSALSRRGWNPDYIVVRRQADLLLPESGDSKLVILAAARLGKTRLLDNLELDLKAPA